MKARTGAETYFRQRLQDPSYSEAHQRATATVSAIDDLVRALDSVREEQRLSKAELARRVGVDPAAVRRFFSTDAPNPTAQWLVQVAQALGYRFSLERDDSAGAFRIGTQMSDDPVLNMKTDFSRNQQRVSKVEFSH